MLREFFNYSFFFFFFYGFSQRIRQNLRKFPLRIPSVAMVTVAGGPVAMVTPVIGHPQQLRGSSQIFRYFSIFFSYFLVSDFKCFMAK